MAQFDLVVAIRKLNEMISQHQDVADKMTPDEVTGYLAANYPWMQGLANKEGIDQDLLARAACCWSFQWGVQYNQNQGLPVDAEIPLSVWQEPSDYRARCQAFTDAIGALTPYVKVAGRWVVRPEYGG